MVLFNDARKIPIPLHQYDFQTHGFCVCYSTYDVEADNTMKDGILMLYEFYVKNVGIKYYYPTPE
jgi:hypothetical protein